MKVHERLRDLSVDEVFINQTSSVRYLSLKCRMVKSKPYLEWVL